MGEGHSGCLSRPERGFLLQAMGRHAKRQSRSPAKWSNLGRIPDYRCLGSSRYTLSDVTKYFLTVFGSQFAPRAIAPSDNVPVLASARILSRVDSSIAGRPIALPER